MKVDFMIIGAQKSGTTTLFDTLKDHPAIAGCKTKEPHFFSTSENWRRELPDYERLFPEAGKTSFAERRPPVTPSIRYATNIYGMIFTNITPE